MLTHTQWEKLNTGISWWQQGIAAYYSLQLFCLLENTLSISAEYADQDHQDMNNRKLSTNASVTPETCGNKMMMGGLAGPRSTLSYLELVEIEGGDRKVGPWVPHLFRVVRLLLPAQSCHGDKRQDILRVQSEGVARPRILSK